MTGINGPLTGRVIGTRVVATHVAYRCERYPHHTHYSQTQFVREVKSQWWQPNTIATLDPYDVPEHASLVDSYLDTPPTYSFASNERRYLRIPHETHGIIIGQTSVADGVTYMDDHELHGVGWQQTRSIQLLQIATPSRDGNKLYPARIVLAHPNDIEVQSEVQP